MIKDFREFDDVGCITADVGIVGGGAAGITFAKEFLGSHFKVLVLESGGLDKEVASQKLNESEVVGLPHVGVEKGRFRAFGGSTIAWGGQTLRLRALDFTKRSWVPNSGW